MATVNQEANTEIEEDTPLYRKNLQKVLGLNVIAGSTRTDQNFRPPLNFVKKKETVKLSVRISNNIGTTYETSYTYKTIARDR